MHLLENGSSRRQHLHHWPHLLPVECPTQESFQGTFCDGECGDNLANQNNVNPSGYLNKQRASVDIFGQHIWRALPVQAANTLKGDLDRELGCDWSVTCRIGGHSFAGFQTAFLQCGRRTKKSWMLGSSPSLCFNQSSPPIPPLYRWGFWDRFWSKDSAASCGCVCVCGEGSVEGVVGEKVVKNIG